MRHPSALIRSAITLSALAVLCSGTAYGAAAEGGGPVQPPALAPLEARSIGPAWGGRVARAVGVPGDPNTYYAATAGGGVWRSRDGGRHWDPIFDDQPVSSIGSIALAPSNPQVIYVGSGEANIRGNVASGNGIYTSTDGGDHWQHAWTQVGQIGAMAVAPDDPDTAFAAVLGHAFGPNPERGVYRTRDGGRTWQRVLAKDENTGASDVAIAPGNSRILFAGLWQARRMPWGLTSGGPGSGLYRSLDGGDRWEELTGHGLPEKPWGKVGVAFAPSRSGRIYALIEAAEGGLFRSDDFGDEWTRVSASRKVRQRAWYYTTLAVDPTNADDVWCPQVAMWRSVDGGRSFEEVEGIHHGDLHDVWFDPRDARRIIVANDGGVDISTDGGESWFAPPLPIAQFYHVSVDSRDPFWVAGAMQDIGTGQGPSNSLHRGGIRDTDWHEVGGGEAGWVVSDPADPAIVYAGEYGGYISRYDDRTGQARNVGIYPDNPSGHGAEDLDYRFQWTAPIAVSPHDPKLVYHGANVLFASRDGGQHWKAISPDLTRDDATKQKWAGGPITGDNTGVEVYDTIFSVAESPLAAGLVWAGSDDGLVHLTRDGGGSWTDVTGGMPAMPHWGTVAMIEPSHFDPAAAYVVVDDHRMDDRQPYLYATKDYGKSWKRLDGGLPRDVYLHAVREDPLRRGTLYVGTERGVVYSTDDGGSWHRLALNLPTVAVHDLQISGDSLVLGTLGRSVWIFDDLGAVRQLTPELTRHAVTLLAPPTAVRRRYTSAATDRWSGDNPPAGARLYYDLRDEPAHGAELEIKITDAQGRLVRTLSSRAQEPSGAFGEYGEEERKELEKQALPTKAGIDRAVWDLRWEGAKLIPGSVLDAGYPGEGPLAVPGTYHLELRLGEETATTELTVEPDPRVGLSQEDLEKQLAFALQVRSTLDELAGTVARLRAVEKQLADRQELVADRVASESYRTAAQALGEKLDAVARQLHNPDAEVVYDILAGRHGGAQLYSRLAPLFAWVVDADGVPTQGMETVYAAERRELARLEGNLDRLLDRELPALDREGAKLGLPPVYRPAGADGRGGEASGATPQALSAPSRER